MPPPAASPKTPQPKTHPAPPPPPPPEPEPEQQPAPAPATQALLQHLGRRFRYAKSSGLCSVAAAAYAAHHPLSTSPPSTSTPSSSQFYFRLRPHVRSVPPDGAAIMCSCASTCSVPLQPPNHRRRAKERAIRRVRHHYASHRHQRDDRHFHSHQQTNTNSNMPIDTPTTCDNPTASDNPAASEPNDMLDLRRQMQNLDDHAKMALVRDKMMSRYKRSKTLELDNNIRRLFEDQYKRLSCNGAILKPPNKPTCPDQMLGCRHYARRCKLKAKCCGLFVACRFCHDEAMSEDHEMDRFATETVLCMLCLTEQPVGPTCIQCHVDFAHYYCSECRFYENTPDKNVYHCARCRICRLGKGLDIDNYHCDKCDACVALQSKPYHRCMNKALHANCPVCRGYLFTSTEPVVFMRCGHTMHSKCFDDYTTGSYQCPLCMRSLTNMERYFEQIDEVVQSEPMPEEFANKRSLIFCNDCEHKSRVRYHFMYHKCENAECRSYNTKVLDVYDEDGGSGSGARPARAPRTARTARAARADRDETPAGRQRIGANADTASGAHSATHAHIQVEYERSGSGDGTAAESSNLECGLAAAAAAASGTVISSYATMYPEDSEDSGLGSGRSDEGPFTQPPIESTV